jgi:hypothetical protein
MKQQIRRAKSLNHEHTKGERVQPLTAGTVSYGMGTGAPERKKDYNKFSNLASFPLGAVKLRATKFMS